MTWRTSGGLEVTPLGLAVGLRQEATESIPGFQPRSLPGFVEPQEQPNWSWAALGASIGNLLGTGRWTQCQVATGCRSQPHDCCGRRGPCNVYGYLDRALAFTGALARVLEGRVPPAVIAHEIGRGGPVCARLGWAGGGAHFVALTGCSGREADPDLTTVCLEDPLYGASVLALADFPAQYQGGAAWTTTYYTKAA